MERRFIEEDFPVDEVSIESSLEKNSRHGNISTLHIWWARKPQSASRVTALAALLPYSESVKENNKNRNLLISLSKTGSNLDDSKLQEARDIIHKKYNSNVKILDPFCGGGSILFEASRLGCETYASDYNPVASIITKCATEFPQKYGNSESIQGLKKNIKNNLYDDLKKWGDWVGKETEKELSIFFPNEKENFIKVAHIWANVITCQNPSCKAEIPLIGQYWLAKKSATEVILYPQINKNKIHLEVVEYNKKIHKNFNPNQGTVKKGHVICPACNSTTPEENVKKLFREKKSSEKLIVIISQKASSKGKKYRVPKKEDISNFLNAEKHLLKKINKLEKEWKINPIPDEFIYVPLKKKYVFGEPLYNFTPMLLYGILTWGELFNSRQKLVLITFIENIRKAYDEMIKIGYDKHYAQSIVTYLGIGMDRLADYNSKISILNPTGGRGVVHTFGRTAIQMMWSYAESNPFNPFGGGWTTACKKNEEWVKIASDQGVIPTIVKTHSSTKIPYDDEFFDVVITDPPYYDMVPYSILSDFFYVWLKRAIGYLYPDLFSTPLTPKSEEIIAEVPRLRRINKAKAHEIIKDIKSSEDFEKKLEQSFGEIFRVLKPNGISIIVYAYRTTLGWENVIKSLLKSGLVVTASWPINTEMKGRLRAQNSASIASSIYMITRKLEKEAIGFYRDVKKELKNHIKNKLEFLLKEKITGMDFFISAIGSAIEVFGRYKKVLDDSDNEISVTKLLNDTREIVTMYALQKVLKNDFSEEISKMTRLYILWRWAYGGTKVPYDDAKKIAQSTGIDLDHEWNNGFIVKEKDVIQVIGPQDRTEEDLEDSHELIDVLHKTLLIWRTGKKEMVEKYLEEKGYKNSEMFKHVARAISESLPQESTEKKWLDGFLTGFKADDSQSETQSKLF